MCSVAATASMAVALGALGAAGALLTTPAAAQTNAAYQCINLRSGANQGISFISANGPMVPLRSALFTSTDFADACGGLPAQQVTPTGGWIPSLPANSAAQWISVDSGGTPRSTLFCQNFDVSACNLQLATLQFWFAADERLGDPQSGPNPIGVYLNGQPVPGFAGGSLGAQTSWYHNNVGSWLVPGTNRLQVYQRDLGGSTGGVIYSARICYLPCQATEVIRLRTGNAAIGSFDPLIKHTFGPAATPIKATTITPGSDPLFFAAGNGPHAQVTSSALHWCPSLTADPLARWIGTDQQLTPHSAIYSQTFGVKSCGIMDATLRFDFSVDDALGDMGAPGNLGLYLNGMPITGSILNGYEGDACDLTFAANVTGLVWAGSANTLQVYVSDDDGFRAGIIYSARLSIVPCATPETIVLRSSAVNSQYILTWSGPPLAPLSSNPFGPGEFNNARFSPYVAVVPNSIPQGWCQSLPCDPLAGWVSVTSTSVAQSALYAHPFTVTTCQNNIKRVKLDICFCADDSLGDNTAYGGPNPSGLYLNGHAIPMSGVFGGWASSTSFSTYVPANWLLNGGNVLYLYNRDTLGLLSGVLYSAKITILPCTPFIIYGEGCGNPAPTMAMATNPVIGRRLETRITAGAAFAPALTFLGASDRVWSGIPLPLDLSGLGAVGCSLLASMDAQLPFVLTDALGEAGYALSIPNDLGLVDQTLFFQTIVVDARANALGLSLSAGHAVTLTLPEN